MTIERVAVLLIVLGPTLALLAWIVVEEIRGARVRRREQAAFDRWFDAEMERGKGIAKAEWLHVIQGGRR